MKAHDAIVIGADHNGPTAAAYLTRAGLDIVVLERNAHVGGVTVSRELYPGFTAPRDHEFFVLMHFRARAQANAAWTHIVPQPQPTDALHQELVAKVQTPIFIC